MRILAIGACSEIGQKTLRLLARNNDFYLTCRSRDRAEVISADIVCRGAAQVRTEALDLIREDFIGVINRAFESFGGIDCLFIFSGFLPADTFGHSTLSENMAINATAPMQILQSATCFFEDQGYGQIIVIGSVAGDRGRATNYAYGAAKGALEIFLSGLRQRLSKHGVNVLVVKPGFVDTPMTSAFRKGPLWASPQRVAKDIVRAMEKGKRVIYTPWYWRWVMFVIRLIPEWMFVRLRF